MSVLYVKVCFLDAAERWILFLPHIHSVSLEFPNNQTESYHWAMLIPVILFLWFFFLVWNYLFLVFSWVWLTFSCWSFPSNIFCRAGLVDILLKDGFILGYLSFSFIETESFEAYCSLGWHLWSLRFCRTSVQVIPAFRVSTDDSDVNLCRYLVLFPCSF